MSKTVIHSKTIPVVGIDLFCGVGGLTHGLSQGGIKITAGIDIDPECEYPFQVNNKALFLNRDLRSLDSSELRALFPENCIRVIAGCAPCQPFSTYSRKGRNNRQDQKWDLLLDFGRLVEEIKPELITMENVPQVLDHPIFEVFLKSLSEYHLWYQCVDCVDYGIPQTRKRLVLLASRLGPIELIKPTHKGRKRRTVGDVIYKLPPLEAGETDPYDNLHTASSLSDLNLARIKASKPGGTWRDWPKQLRAKCHKKQSGETYPSVYGRMEWDLPAPTITTQCFGFGNGRFGHPDQNRAISLREAALIQTFPKNYKFVPVGKVVKFSVLGRLIGNAVPVRLGRVIAESINFHIASLNNKFFANMIEHKADFHG